VNTSERIRFVAGARLASRDLRAEAAAQSRARQLHVRRVHDTWGIALGYAVGAVGRWLVVGPGIAYDCRGHELIRSRTVALVPPVPRAGGEAWFDLALRRLDDADLRGPETLCASGRAERAGMTWTFAGPAVAGAPSPPVSSALRLGEAVPLARVRVGSGDIRELSLTERRAARSAAGARVASGTAELVLPADGSLHSTQTIDTSGAGFQAPPAYFASVSVAGASVHGALHQSGLLGPFLSVANAGATGFELTVRFATWESTWMDETEPAVGIDWIGVEPIHGCWPAVHVTQALLAAGAPVVALVGQIAQFTAQPVLGPVLKRLEEVP